MEYKTLFPIATAKDNDVNILDYMWYIMVHAPACNTTKDWDSLLPWNIDPKEYEKLHDIVNSAKPAPNRTKPYNIRGIH